MRFFNSYEAFNVDSAGAWSALDNAVATGGAALYHILFTMGIWVALAAVIGAGVGFAWYGNNSNQLPAEKKHLCQVILCILVFISSIGVFTCILGAVGLDLI